MGKRKARLPQAYCKYFHFLSCLTSANWCKCFDAIEHLEWTISNKEKRQLESVILFEMAEVELHVHRSNLRALSFLKEVLRTNPEKDQDKV